MTLAAILVTVQPVILIAASRVLSEWHLSLIFFLIKAQSHRNSLVSHWVNQIYLIKDQWTPNTDTFIAIGRSDSQRKMNDFMRQMLRLHCITLNPPVLVMCHCWIISGAPVSRCVSNRLIREGCTPLVVKKNLELKPCHLLLLVTLSSTFQPWQESGTLFFF